MEQMPKTQETTDEQIELEVVQDYRFYQKDIVGKNILLGPLEGGRPSIRGGSLEKLVERLTYEKYPGTFPPPLPKFPILLILAILCSDTTFLNSFLLTYRVFTNCNELLDLLIMRYILIASQHKWILRIPLFRFHIPKPKLQTPEILEKYRTSMVFPTQLRYVF